MHTKFQSLYSIQNQNTLSYKQEVENTPSNYNENGQLYAFDLLHLEMAINENKNVNYNAMYLLYSQQFNHINNANLLTT